MAAEQLEMETRMRDGLCKLLAASTSRDQALRAAKALALCHGRLRGLRAHLRRPSEAAAEGRGSDVAAKDRVACRGKVGISDLRIPLMWKNSDHFNSKDRTERYSVFCLFKMGAQVYDSDLLIVDKADTDICLENTTIFEGAGPDFQLKVEVYSCCCGEDPLTLANTPRKLVKKLKTSLGKSTGKKFSSALDQKDLETLLTETATHGVKYSLLASACLSLENAKDGFNAHSLTLLGNEDSPSWLPLYGTLCCRLVAQPDCMTHDAMTGFLNEQPSGGVPGESWRRRYCVLRGGQLLCFSAPEEREADAEPALSVPINRETHIRPVDKGAEEKANLFSIINPEPGEATARIFQAENRQDLCKWMEAFSQHFFDFSQWKHCCEEFMRMEIRSPQKPPLFLAKEATSVYQELSIDSPVKPLVARAQHEEEESKVALFVGLDEADMSGGSSLKQSESSPQGSRDSEGTSKGREPPSRP